MDPSADATNDFYDAGNFSQEMWENIEQIVPNQTKTKMTSANLYVNCNAQVVSMCNLIEGDIEISNCFQSCLATICSEFQLEMMKKKNTKKMEDEGEFVSCSTLVDNRRVYKHKKVITERISRKK